MHQMIFTLGRLPSLLAFLPSHHFEEDWSTGTTTHCTAAKVLAEICKTLDICVRNCADFCGSGWVKRDSIEGRHAKIRTCAISEVDERIPKIRSIVSSPGQVKEVIP